MFGSGRLMDERPRSNVDGWTWDYFMGHERAALHLSSLCNTILALLSPKEKNTWALKHTKSYTNCAIFSRCLRLCYSRWIFLGWNTRQPAYIIRDDRVMKSNHIQNFELVYPNIGPDFIESIEKIMKCVSGGGLVTRGWMTIKHDHGYV